MGPSGGGLNVRGGRCLAGVGHTQSPADLLRPAIYPSVGADSPGSGRAAKVGGGRDGRPRQSRMARVVSGGWMAARMCSGPPQAGHSRMSMVKTRLRPPTQA